MSVNVSEDYFEVIFEDRPLKYVCLCFSFVSMMAVCSLAAGIIWFEYFGSDLKRIFINRIVSSVCWTILEGFLLFQTPDMLLYFYRPFPSWICNIQIILRHAFVLQVPLLLDAMLIARYIFIFWMKNPLQFDDIFWCTLVNVGIFMFRYWLSFPRMFLSLNTMAGSLLLGLSAMPQPGGGSESYTLCSGRD